MGRFLCVSINHQHSMFLPVLCRVTQGSRPMLYIIYVNDLPHSIKYCHTLICANDIKCYLPIASCQDSINLHNISMKSHISVLNGIFFSRNLQT